MRQNAIESCSCQRKAGEALMAPVCEPELYAGERNDGSLFVKRPKSLVCPSLRHFAYGDFCMCDSRKQVYLEYGI